MTAVSDSSRWRVPTSPHPHIPQCGLLPSESARTHTSAVHPLRNSKNMLDPSLRIAISISPGFKTNQKPPRTSTDFRGWSIRDDPRQSVAKAVLLISYPLRPRTRRRSRLRLSWPDHYRRLKDRSPALAPLPASPATAPLCTSARPAYARPGSDARGLCPWLTCRRLRAPSWRRRLRSRRRRGPIPRSCHPALSASSRLGKPWSRADSWRRSRRVWPCLPPSALRHLLPSAPLLLSTGRKTR